jgi:hypothetical protein
MGGGGEGEGGGSEERRRRRCLGEGEKKGGDGVGWVPRGM